jgi:hypothetical protein
VPCESGGVAPFMERLRRDRLETPTRRPGESTMPSATGAPIRCQCRGTAKLIAEGPRFSVGRTCIRDVAERWAPPTPLLRP